MIRDIVRAAGGQVLGERYLPLGGSDLSASLAEILQLKPDVIINTINSTLSDFMNTQFGGC
jgi:urea transport system substrate-binding protein